MRTFKEVLCILTQEENKTFLIHFDLQAAGEMANVIVATLFHYRNFLLFRSTEFQISFQSTY